MGRPVDVVPMPVRVALLPRNHVGYPIPWFVPDINGVRDFRIASADRMVRAVKLDLCWICGRKLGPVRAVVIGPMCAVNRLSSEPPQHRDCAVYAARVCPFLVSPAMRRRPGGKPDGMIPAAGEMIERNPGVALVWLTRTVTPFRPPIGNDGLLFGLGEPTETLWFREGRAATRAEVAASIESGLPALLAACDRDDDPEQSRHDVLADAAAAMGLLPA